MYMLFKNNRPVGNKKFNTYEKCRQWARKLARKNHTPWDVLDLNALFYRTPTLGDYGYSIRSV